MILETFKWANMEPSSGDNAETIQNSGKNFISDLGRGSQGTVQGRKRPSVLKKS